MMIHSDISHIEENKELAAEVEHQDGPLKKTAKLINCSLDRYL